MNCVTNSKSLSPDIRILRVAEHLAKEGMERIPNILREIAGEVRAMMTDQSSSTIDACLTLLETASSEVELFDAWRVVVPSMPPMEAPERLQIIEAWITRICVVSMDDGR